MEKFQNAKSAEGLPNQRFQMSEARRTTLAI